MIEVGNGSCAKVLAAAFLISATLLIWATPVPAQEELVGGYVVSLAEVARFGGSIEAKTFKCPTKGSCVALMRVEVRGETYDYFVFVKATATTATIAFSGRNRVGPELITGSGDQIVVPRSSDGTGSQDTTLTALTASYWYTSKSYTLREMLPPRLQLANLRVTVRREDGMEGSR